MTEFEKAVVAEVKRVREVLQRDNSFTQFVLRIEASGRVHDGEVKIIFGVGSYTPGVESNNVDGAVREYMRRRGFDQLNSGLVLTGPGTIENIDDITF